MDLKLEDLIALAMQLPAATRRYLAQQLSETAALEVRDSGEPYGAPTVISRDLVLKELLNMTSVTLVLPDDLAKQARAAGLLAGKPLEELIRRALHEQSAGSSSDESASRQRRRVVRENGRLVVEALIDEKPITASEAQGLLNNMEW